MENIFSEFLMIVPALNFIGFLLKNYVPQLPNNTIPFILLGLAIIGTCSLSGISVINIIQGVLVAASSILTHTGAKTVNNKLKNKEKK